jgi:predicted Zn finger-like uncharacterized protein
MRLVCPNCGAQYEVDDRVIPESGRDVQCSACGHAWYQMPAEHDDEADVDDTLVDERLTADTPDEAEDDTDEIEAEAEASPAVSASDDHGPEDEAPDERNQNEDGPDEGPKEDGEADTATPEVKPRVIDDGVRSILQEEAKRELEARAEEPRAENEQVETQPDLGLDSGPSPEEERRRVARERLARMRGMEEEDLAVPDFDGHAEPVAEEEPRPAAHGRDLFPDIEEINSTLDRHAGTADDIEPGGVDGVTNAASGFRRGFALILLVAILLVALYVLAPKLAETIPALRPTLAAYVDAVNNARGWLDEMLRGLIAKIESAAGAE